MLPTNRGFWLAFLLTIVTLGFYQWYLIYAFAKETNTACKGDGRSTTGLFLFIVFSILTLGIYSIVWYCMWISRCNTYLAVNGRQQGLQVSTYLIAVFLGEELLAAAFANHIHSYTSHHDLIPLPSSTESFVLIIRACSYCAFTPGTKYSVLPFSMFFRF